MDNKEAGANGILIIDNTGLMLPIIKFNSGVEHFLLNILKLLVSKIVENEMISKTGEYKIGVSIIFLFDGNFNILGDSFLNLLEMLILKLIIVICEMMWG